MGLTGSRFVPRARRALRRETRRYYQQLTRFSAALAFLADVSMVTLGGALKRKEKLSARLGDVLSLLYLVLGDAEALRGRGPAAGRRAADALGDLGRAVSRRRARSKASSRISRIALDRGHACAASSFRSAGRTSFRPIDLGARVCAAR